MTKPVDPHDEPVVNALPLRGLRFAPPQVWGGVRLVPLLRDGIRTDLRLSQRAYAEDLAVVSVDPRTQYVAFVPHGLVANWTTDGGAVFGTQVDVRSKRKDGETFGGILTARGLKKMARREGKHQLRFLPQHVAMEGFLALHFGGPSIAWSEYSRSAIRTGLSPVAKQSFRGTAFSD